MLNFDFTNLLADKVGNEHGLTKDDAASLEKEVGRAHEKIQSWRKSKDAYFYDLVFDEHLTDGIGEKAKEVAKTFKNVVVLGIGGSALGLKAAAGALLPPLYNLTRQNSPRLFVCDNIDPETFDAIMETIDLKETCFVIISKSGKTTETAAQFFIVLEKLQREIGNHWQKHIVIITDPELGELRPFVTKEKIASFAIPPKLGGRFSVLSAVGLFPAACVGMDIKGLIDGAREMAVRCKDAPLVKNPAYTLGGYHFYLDTKKGKSISVMMPYSDAFSLTADWYVQLWAESLGKNGKGQTPLTAVGATDQHSQVQLFMEGPNNKVFTIIGTEGFRTNTPNTRINKIVGSFDYLKGHDLGSILNAEKCATTEALTKKARPNLSISFPKIDAHHLGEFFMAYEIATAFAGALYDINPFDQPGVELGKVLTKEKLMKR